MSNLKIKPLISVNTSLILICIILLIPSLILLFATSWHGDEYLQSHQITTAGWTAFWLRLIGWSPRPFSDGILTIYYLTVTIFKEPFVWLFLLLNWLTLSAFMFFAIRETIKKYSRVLESSSHLKKNNLYLNLTLPLLITLVLFIYFIFIEKPSEIFFWPAGTVPYLFGLLGIIVISCHFINLADSENITYQDVFKIIIFSIIAAFSSEASAVYQFIFSVFLLSIIFLSRQKNFFSFLPFSKLNKPSSIWLGFSVMISLASSALVLYMIKNSRVGKAELNSLKSPIAGKFADSFILALGRFFQELFSLDDLNSDKVSVLVKIVFFLLMFLLFSRSKIVLPKPVKIICLVIITSLLLSNFIMLAAVYYQFGEVCCARHLHFRSILLGLAIFLAALALARDNLPSLLHKDYSLLGIFSLTMILLVSLQFESIKIDLFNFNYIVSINKSNWQNNVDSSSTIAKYQNHDTYANYVITFRLDPGAYSCANNMPDLNRKYMDYFHKNKLYVSPPEVSIPKIVSQEKSINFSCPSSIPIGSIDLVNGISSTNLKLDNKQNLEIIGWATNQDLTRPATQVIITLDDSLKVVAQAQIGLERPDIANALNNPNLLASGWRALVSSDKLIQSPANLKAWSYEPSTKVAIPLNQTFQITFP